jgi:flagellar biosynthesis protein FlhA
MAKEGKKGMSSFLSENTQWMQKSDILMGIGVITVVVMLIFPMPTFLLDFFLTISIMSGLLILMIVMFVKRPFDFSVFPSLLLITTIFRLALNISSTRLILMQGAAFEGKIIRAFGDFVVGGNYVIGVIIFIILVTMQFMVITKGATRTAEVAARFTLDAMPGKQMSIDSDLSNGLITEDEAKIRRGDIRREADFYGAMDGASKFVQGEVKVGIVIILVNLIGGFVVGMVMHGESFDTALRTYTLLSIGDGLVAQIPSLLITTATGIIVTRSISEGDLGGDIAKQFKLHPRAFFITAAALGAMAIIPGFPVIPNLVIASFLAILGFIIHQSKEEESAKLLKDEKDAKKEQKTESVLSLIQVDPIEFTFGIGLIPLFDPEEQGVSQRIPNIRRGIARDLGFVVPPIRIRDDIELEDNSYSILLKGVEIGGGKLRADKLMAMDSGNVTEKIDGDEFTEPVFRLTAIWIDSDKRDEAEMRGYTVVDCSTIIATHLTEIIKQHADEILDRQQAKQLIDNIKQEYPMVVDELLTEKKFSLGDIQSILRNLLREGVSIKNMVTILETIATYADRTNRSISLLTEYVRIAISRQICKSLIDKDNTISLIRIDPEIEDQIASSIHEDPIEGSIVSLDPDSHRKIMKTITDAYKHAKSAGFSPIYVVSPGIRAVSFNLIQRELADATVLSYNEIIPEIKVKIIGSALLSEAA